MPTALRLTTTVLTGNRVEVSAPELREGDAVEVILVLPEISSGEHTSALDTIEALGGHRLFHSTRDVDDHLQVERDAWER